LSKILEELWVSTDLSIPGIERKNYRDKSVEIVSLPTFTGHLLCSTLGAKSFSYFLLFIYLHVHTLFGSFLPLAPALTLFPPPPSLAGRTCSALFSSSVEQ
jgi:hypothetical protein